VDQYHGRRRLCHTSDVNFFENLLVEEAEGKAYSVLSDPRLLDYADAPVYQPGSHPREDAKISQREAGAHSDLYGGGQAIDWVMDCVRLYADSTATADWHLERAGKALVREKTPNTPDDVDVGPQDLYRLLDSPNPYMDYAELVDLLVIDLLLVGNAYWFKWRVTDDGKPLALYRLCPSYVKIIPDRYGPKRYEYQPPGAKDPLPIPPAQIMHMRLPNPHSAYYGLGLVQGGGRALDLELALTDTQASYYNNNADPSLIIESERRVPRDVFNKLRAQVRARTAGSRNAGELLVLEAGLKASTLSRSAREALFEEITKMSRDRIFAMFRTSPRLFGITDEQSGSDKITDLRREFDTKTMRPFLDRLQKRISAGLTQSWGVDFKIEYLYRMPEEEVVKQGGSLASIPGIKVREVRRFLAPLGIEESTGDDKIDELVLNLPTPEIGPDGMITDPLTGQKTRPVGADRPLPGEPGRPPKGENTKAIGRGSSGKKALSDAEVDAIMAVARAESKALKSSEPEPVLNPAKVRKLVGDARPSDTFKVDRIADVDAVAADMHSEIMKAVHVLERDLLDHSEGKAFPKDSDLVKRIRKSEAWKTFMAFLAPALEKGAKRAVASASIHSALHPEDDVDYEALAKRIVWRKDGIEGITANLKDDISKKVAQVLNTGGSRDDVERVIREAVQFWRETHAETVALTEATRAYNEGTLTVAEMAGVTNVMVQDGHDHDQPCIDADGSVWTIAHAREHSIEHPRCRRAFTPLPEVS
jgi:HK97 family phage portal protein